MPTFVLALGSVFPQHRSDHLFGVLFGVTRLGFFGFAWLVLQWHTASIAHPLLLLLPGAGAMAMHVSWFRKWTKSQQSRSGKSAGGEAAAAVGGDALAGGGGGAAAGAGAVAEARAPPQPSQRDRTPTLESASGVAPASSLPPEPKIHAPPAAPGVIHAMAAAANKPKTLRPPAPRKTN